MSETQTTEIASPSIRWRGLVIIAVLTVLGLAGVWLPENFWRGMRTVGTAVVLGLAAAGLLAWFLGFSGFSRQVRMAGLAVVALVALGVVATLRIDTFDGDMVPILAWRWTPTPEEQLIARRTAAPSPQPAAADPLPDITENDYPGFLGHNRLAVVKGRRLQPDWSAHPPKELWRRAVGPGWSAFAVVGDFAFTQEQRGDEEVVACYDLRTGEPRWVHADKARFDETLGGPGPRATPTIDGGRLYTQGATGILNCLDAATGRRIWSVNILEDNGASNIDWGMAASPLVHDGLVIVAPGGPNGHSLVAYDAQTGWPRWHAGSDQAAYASPLLATLAGVKQVLILTAASLASHDPQTGELLWRFPWEGQPIKCAQPAVLADFGEPHPDRVLISSGYAVGSVLLEIARENGRLVPRPVWDTRRLRSKFANLIVREGHVYGLDEGIFTCLELETGRRVWKQGRYGHGQLLQIDDLLLVQAESGEVLLLEATPQGAREIARLAALSSKTWNHPALAGRLLLVRNDREAACYELPMLESAE